MVLQLPSQTLYPLSYSHIVTHVVKSYLFNLRMSKTLPHTLVQYWSTLVLTLVDVQDGVLHRPGGRELPLPHRPGSPGQEIRDLLLRDRETGGRHRDPDRQVQERQVRAHAGKQFETTCWAA